MTITRAAVEKEVAAILGRILMLVSLDPSYAGANPTFNGPMRDALTRMGYSTADPITVADIDLAALNPAALRRLIEWTELFLLEQVERDWWRIYESPTPVPAEVLGSLKSRLVARVAALREIVRTPYQSMNLPISVGQIAAGSAADRSLPPSPLALIPPWSLAPDGLWLYGCTPAAFWGYPYGGGYCP